MSCQCARSLARDRGGRVHHHGRIVCCECACRAVSVWGLPLCSLRCCFFAFDLAAFLRCFGTAGEHSWGERALRRSGQLGREASKVVVRHSNKDRTSIAFLVSYKLVAPLGSSPGVKTTADSADAVLIDRHIHTRRCRVDAHGSPKPALRGATSPSTSRQQPDKRPARGGLPTTNHKHHRSGPGRDDRRPGKPSKRGQRHLPADEALR